MSASQAQGPAGVLRRVGRYEALLDVRDDALVCVAVARVKGPHVGPRLVELARVDGALSQDAEVRAAFLAEARAAGRVRHDRFVHPSDTLAHRGELFVATELVHGVRLDELAQAAAAAKVDVPAGVWIRVVLDVLAGLAALHATPAAAGGQRAIVHGDVAPCNVVLNQRGLVRLVHSGLAIAATRVGATKRKNARLAYKAPEQLRPTARAISPAADVFAAGAMLWELLAGRRLFDAPSESETIERVLHAPVPRLDAARAPAAVVELVARALSRDPTERFDGAAPFSELLARASGANAASAADVAAIVGELAGASIEQRRAALDARIAELDAGATRSGAAAGPATGLARTPTPTPVATAVVLREPAAPPSDPLPLSAHDLVPSSDAGDRLSIPAEPVSLRDLEPDSHPQPTASLDHALAPRPMARIPAPAIESGLQVLSADDLSPSSGRRPAANEPVRPIDRDIARSAGAPAEAPERARPLAGVPEPTRVETPEPVTLRRPPVVVAIDVDAAPKPPIDPSAAVVAPAASVRITSKSDPPSRTHGRARGWVWATLACAAAIGVYVLGATSTEPSPAPAPEPVASAAAPEPIPSPVAAAADSIASAPTASAAPAAPIASPARTANVTAPKPRPVEPRTSSAPAPKPKPAAAIPSEI